MLNFYELKILPIILKRFNVNKILTYGLSNEEVVFEILEYCNKYDASCLSIDSKEKLQGTFINNNSLNIVSDLKDFDAIFLNDDANWFTVYNELNTIKSINKEFPLVFICNNIFPNQRRDSYINPKTIPRKFLNNYKKELVLANGIVINDGFFHAIDTDTPQNGVLTAIEDFLEENKFINIMDIHFLNGITILYLNNDINKFRVDEIFKYIEQYRLNQRELTEEIIEKHCIVNYISKFNITDVDSDKTLNDEWGSEKIIKNPEKKIKYDKNNLNKEDAQITIYDSKLKESNIKINYLNNELILNEKNFKNKENKLTDKIKENNILISEMDSKLSINEKELINKELMLESLKQQNINQFSKLENSKYSMSCFKEEVENKKLEIQYHKRNNLTRKFFSPLGYLYLIIKSDIKELSLNLKLYKALKNSNCFDIGFYLNKNKDLQDSKWCKYFSPELHYVCKGFNEEREFNKKYFDTNSKKELLNYILNSSQ